MIACKKSWSAQIVVEKFSVSTQQNNTLIVYKHEAALAPNNNTYGYV